MHPSPVSHPPGAPNAAGSTGTISPMPGDDEEERWRPGPLLPPQDRTWLHPAELGGVPADLHGARVDRRVPLGLLTLAGTALLVLGVVWLAAGSPSESTADPSSPAGHPAADVGSARTAAPAATSVRIRTRDGVDHEVSGIWLDSAGHVITGATAVRDAVEIRVAVGDGDPVTATVIGHDRSGELAVLGTGRPTTRPAVFAGRPLDPGVGARVTTGSGATADVEVDRDGTLRLTAARAPEDLVGSAVIGPNDTIAAIVIGIVDDELLTVPAARLHADLPDPARTGSDLVDP